MQSAAEVIDKSVAKLLPLVAKDPVAVNYCKVHSARYRTDIATIFNLVPPGGLILDFGAYPYVMSDALAACGYKVVAGDIYPEKCPIPAPSFSLAKCDANADKFDLESDHFDAVILTEVFEHVHNNPITLAKELLRVLKPGGVLYLTTPNGLGMRKIAKVLRTGRFQDVYEQWAPLAVEGIMGHVTEYTPTEIEQFLQRCGYVDVRVTTKNVYKKNNRIEHYFWRTITAPFRKRRETIIAVARKPTA